MAEELRIENQRQQISKVFPIKPKTKPKPRTRSQTAESKYWSSFKSHQIPDLFSSIPSISFSPIHPHVFAVPHSTSISLFSSETLTATHSVSFSDVVSSCSFRCDGALLAVSDLSGLVQVIDAKTRTKLRRLRSHTRPARFVKFPVHDKLHLVSGGDDAVVKYWDVAGESVVLNLTGHKDYVRCGDCSPVNDDMFITGSYDHTIKLWDVRVGNTKPVMEIKNDKPVEDVIFLPSGGLIATGGGNTVKIWDVLAGGKMVSSMETHNKTVTSLCVGRVGKDNGEETETALEHRLFSVALDGYLKVFDYNRMKVTYSMRFPAPLMSVGFSPDGSTRVIGASNGNVFAGKKKVKDEAETKSLGLPEEEKGRRALNPSSFRYFQRGQNEKPAKDDLVVMKQKRVKLAEHDRLLKQFRHKEALVAVLKRNNPDNVVAVMEELIARKKLMRCVMNLDKQEELGLLMKFLTKNSVNPSYARLLMGLTKKVLESRVEDIRGCDELKSDLQNLKGSINEELRIQDSLLEIQGIIYPLLRIAGGR